MISLSRLVEITFEEVERAVANPLNKLSLALHPGIILQPALAILATIGSAFHQFSVDVVQSMTQVAPRVLGRMFTESSPLGPSTRVVRLDKAQKFAAELCLGAVFDLAGGRAPAGLDLVARTKAVTGIRKRFISREESQILGPVLKKILSFIRSPVTLVIAIVQTGWRIVVSVAALGAVFALYNVIASDWTGIALSQSRRRKRMVANVNKRL